MAIILGIDPGLSGALCAYSIGGGPVALFDLPIIQDGRKTRQLDVKAFAVILKNLDVTRVVLERQAPMPRDGCVQAFRTGMIFGQLRASVESMGIPLSLVSPVTWKKWHGLLNTEKEQGRLKAKAMFANMAPNLERVKDHNRADAILIADWGASHWRGLAAGTV